MADITRFPFLRHLRANPTAHVRHLRKGKVAHDGPGQAFWFRPLTAALSEIPVDDREQPLLFHARTADFQDVTVQATVTYRVVDPALAATRLDFGIDPDHGHVAGHAARAGRRAAHRAGPAARPRPAGRHDRCAEALAEGMAAVRERDRRRPGRRPPARRHRARVIDVRVVAVRAEPEVERALQTPTREQVQQDADQATYERRALAVERERAIAENELQNQIELARREEQLVDQQGQNERKRADRAGRRRPHRRPRPSAEQQRLLADAQADATRLVGQAEADAEAARLAAYGDARAGRRCSAWPLKELAGNLPEHRHPNLTPDLLTAAAGPPGRAGADRGSGVTLAPRAVVVHRRTELDELLARHGTRQQAAFFLRTRGREPRRGRGPPRGAGTRRWPAVTGGHPARLAPGRGRARRPRPVRVRARGRRGRRRPGRPGGQRGQVPRRPAGRRHQPRARPQPRRAGPPPARRRSARCSPRPRRPSRRVEQRTMVEAVTDDGQVLRALNEIYVGARRATSRPRYRIEPPDGPGERQSSSGVLVGTGTGATGWCRSAWLERHSAAAAPRPRPSRRSAGSSGRPGPRRPPAPT